MKSKTITQILIKALKTLQTNGKVCLNDKVENIAMLLATEIYGSQSLENVEKLLTQLIKHVHYQETTALKFEDGEGYITTKLKVIQKELF
jgi:uncharacterized alkaline shock family protein YloU